MNHNIYIYILIMALVTITIRVLPLTLFKKKVNNTFIKSFLYYVPYITLSIMIFPAILNVSDNKFIGCTALCVGIIVAWFDKNLFRVAVSCSLIVLLLELI